MLCPNCGSLLTDGSRFCPYCGSQLEVQPAQETAPVRSEPYVAQEDPRTPPRYDVIPADPLPADPMHDPRGMKWFKFIIYFQLFASAALNLLNAFQLFTGAQYEGQAERVYLLFPGLKTADLLYGALCLVMAALAIFARFRLAKFRQNGPKLYYTLLIVAIVGALLYLFLASSALSVSFAELMDSSVSGSLIGSAVLLIVNRIYFGKRMDLFVN